MTENELNLDWTDKMYSNLRHVARKYGFQVSTVTVKGKDDFAEFIIKIDEVSMIGLKMNPPFSTKPFRLFPYDTDIGLNEIDEYLEGYALARENLQEES